MYISLDLETTGVDSRKDKIIEFGAVKFDETGIKETLTFLINPEIPLPSIISHLTNIKDSDLAFCPIFKDKKHEIEIFLEDHTIIGHNIAFDIGFLEANGIEIKNPSLDTYILSNLLFPKLPSFSLEILTNYFSLSHKEKHRALDDSIAAMELFTKLKNHFESLDKDLIAKIHKICKKSPGTVSDFLFSLKHNSKTPKLSYSLPKPDIKEFIIEKDLLNSCLEKDSLLIEFASPYGPLANELIKKLDKDTYLCVPTDIFLEISKDPSLESIAKIDLPKNYLSPEKLEKFLDQDTLEPYEFSIAVKSVIFSAQTVTGLLNDMTLSREERENLSKINSENETDFFVKKAMEKDADKAAICSYDYLISQDSQLKNVIILDIEKFLRILSYHNSTYLRVSEMITPLLNLEKKEKNETLSALINKCEILIGLIGIFVKGLPNDNPYPYIQYSLTEEETSFPYWQNIKSSITNLIELSRNLVEIKNTETEASLHSWKEILKNLHEFFFNPDFENNLVLIDSYQNNEIITLKKNPLNTKEKFLEILNKCTSYKLIGEGLDLNDNGIFAKQYFGIPEALPLINALPKEKNKVFIFDSSKERYFSLASFFKKYFETAPLDQNYAVILSSKKQIEFSLKQLDPFLKSKNFTTLSQLAGSINKYDEKIKQSESPIIAFFTTQGWQQITSQNHFQMTFLERVPFMSPEDPHLKSMSRNFLDPFNELQIPLSIMALKKIILRSGETPFVILDERILKKDYGKKIVETLKQFCSLEIICEF